MNRKHVAIDAIMSSIPLFLPIGLVIAVNLCDFDQQTQSEEEVAILGHCVVINWTDSEEEMRERFDDAWLSYIKVRKEIK